MPSLTDNVRSSDVTLKQTRCASAGSPIAARSRRSTDRLARILAVKGVGDDSPQATSVRRCRA